MSTNRPVYPINIWINEERETRLREAGLAATAREVLAGLKVISIPADDQQKDVLLDRFPAAKCDTATTNTIELLPREVKEQLFTLVLERRSLDILGHFLLSLGKQRPPP
ncbi:MAG: hypothetical protein EXR60_01330 [Dehalococcoidia bacterium]|nr:hypothetical protein [Dehalococcoidia bacterium]